MNDAEVPRRGTPADGLAVAPLMTAPRGRRPSPVALLLLVGTLAAFAVVAGGVLIFSSQPDVRTGPSARAAGGPVSEYAASERGEPVQMSGTTLTGSALDISELRGEVVVINVWGSWCVPCREEAPTLAQVSAEYRDRGVQFVGVNIKDNVAAAQAFERRYGISYPSIDDRDGRALLALSQHVPAQAVPVTLILDRQGKVAARVVGVVAESTLRALLDSAVEEP